MKIQTPILIVGAGPVGLALAGDLGWRGIPCVIIEQSDGSIYQPRMDMVGVRTMEFCRRWGIVGDVEQSPYPRDYPQDNIYMAGSLAKGWEIGRYPNPPMGEEKPPPQSPQKRERCPQNMFDPILQKFARSYETVDLRYRHRFDSLGRSDHGVTVQLTDLETDQPLTIDAQYVVGCDGAGSAVRSAVGIEMEGNPALTYTTNVIFRCDGFEALHGIPPGYRFILLGTEGAWATIVAINGRDQWRFSIVRSSDRPRELTEDEVRDAIARAVGIEFDYEILSILPWTRRELVADHYREARVFVCGDAAHMMSPTGGFGMNTGIGDAVDLSWKLAAKLEGWGGEALLDSYDAERRPVAVRNVSEASGNLGRMLLGDNMDRLLDRTAAGETARHQVGLEFSERMKREWQTLGVHLGYRYEGSPVCVPDSTEAPPDDPSVYVQTARPGSRAPHVWRADGSSILDLFGTGFVLLVLRDNPPDPEPLAAAARKCKMQLDVVRVREEAVAAAYETALVLVRPDGHVAWRGDALPDHPERIIETVRGA